MSFNSSFEIIKVVAPESSTFFYIPATAADAAAVNPNGLKTLLANGLITFFINGNHSLIMDQGVCQEVLQIELF